MRPVRISVEGFSAYRSRVDVDLTDVEFFALSGPTGSGKSSLVDAMIFALYGRVPRLGGRAVAPVITAGADRARVAFEFEVDGETYVASRVAERSDTGASVREARLEGSDGTPLASGAGDVTTAVESLLRLRFEDFTKTVVLPQGEFARFLNAGSRERRELLRDLLGLEVYERVRELANDRKSRAAGTVVSARSQLDSLDPPDEGALEEAKSRLATLEELAADIADRVDALDTSEQGLAQTEAALASLEGAVERLRSLTAPDHLEEMEDRLIAAREAEALAEQALEAKKQVIEDLQGRLAALPSEESIAAIRHAHTEIESLDVRKAELDITAIEDEVEEKTAALAAAESRLAEVSQALDRARVAHAAHAVRAELNVGEPCPVCAQVVSELPPISTPGELADVEQAASEAEQVVRTAREGLQAAQVALTKAGTRLSEIDEQRARLAATVADSPSPEGLDEIEALVVRLGGDVDEARGEIGDLETTLRHARRGHEEAAEALRSMGRELMVSREKIADLKPPHSESDDPAVQWKDLLGWRDRRLDELAAEKATLSRRAETERAAVTSMRDSLVEELETAGVGAEHPYAVQVERAIGVARHRVSQIEEVLERRTALEAQMKQAAAEEAVASALAGHLKANGFERWLMTGAITGLVSGANELLSQLSGGGYSLESDEEGSFRIIDHRNADELRDVATLSGGETFLVSLALSLSLAETLSGAGGTGLDAIILDEGFGALDEESLDIVAAVLEELAGKGLMVGIITHVKELAARAPVRYQVTRDPAGSTVEVIT